MVNYTESCSIQTLRGKEGKLGGGEREGPWNCDTDPTSSCLRVKIPGGERGRHQNDKTTSVNIMSSLLADVCRQFHAAAADSAPFVCFF